MNILLDEGAQRAIKNRLPDLAIFTVEEMGWRGVKNGDLLDLMAGKLDIIVTTDKNLPAQQNLAKRRISAIILPTNRIPLVIKLLSQIEEAIMTVAPGEFREIPLPSHS